MSITNRVIQDICRSKYGNAIDAAVRGLDIRDVEDMIENVAWGKAEDMYRDDRRYQDVDHAYSDLSRNQDAYASVVGFAAMVVIGMGLDTLNWFQGEYERELPRQLLADADQAYRSVLRDSGGDNLTEGTITSGYRAGKDEHQQTNPRLQSKVNSGKYRNRDKASGFTGRVQEQKSQPRYSGNEGGFAERMRGERRNYDVAPIELESYDEPQPEQVPVLYINAIELKPFDLNTGVFMESYEMHEIKATKSRHVGLNLPVSKLITLNTDTNASLDIAVGEVLRTTHTDVSPAELLTLPMHKAVDKRISSHTSITEHEFTMSTNDADMMIEAFDNTSVEGILSTLDAYKRIMDIHDDKYTLTSYMVTIISRYVTQGLTLALGEPIRFLPVDGSGWTLLIGELELNFNSIADGVSQLMEAQAYSWAAESIHEIFKVNGFMLKRFSISVDGAELDDAQGELKFIIKQSRIVINAPGHLDTNISHVDSGGIIEVNKANNETFATALRCIEDHVKADGTKVGSVVLIDDYGYALELVTAFGGHKLYIQRHMTY